MAAAAARASSARHARQSIACLLALRLAVCSSGLLPPPVAASPPRRPVSHGGQRARLVFAQEPATEAGSEEDSNGRGTIVPAVLHKEMSDSYMAYAMSVIMSRALPDVRDGLKPVHRRILFAMHELNLQPEGPHRKCARVVGEVLGKYHPHGDNSVYDALVRMAQDFSMRSPLVDGHGNFGSIDPDPAAAMRYTECKLTRLSAEGLLDNVAEDTVDFVDNFDGSEREPSVLPAKLPLLLLNGATGIAVGMATNCPPHNLGEVVKGLQALLADPELSDEELFRCIPAPDFPTGGIVMGTAGARDLYTTGRGSVLVRATAHVEERETRRRSRDAVVVTDLPFGVAKNTLLERIAAMVNEKKLDGIAEIRDESSMQGTRVVFEIKRDADPLVVLNNMYKRSSLQNSFSGNLMAVVGKGRMPEQLTLRSALQAFIDFRVECLERRSRFRLAKAEARLHIVQGLLVAQENMDGVVEAVRAAPNSTAARSALEAQFDLSSAQADAILSMQLRRLTALERDTLTREGATLRATEADLRAMLTDQRRITNLISEEIGELSAKYATPRRTMIGSASDAELNEMDLTPSAQCIIIKSLKGFVKRLPLDEFDAQQRGTRGKAGMTNLQDGDAVVQMFSCNTHDTVLCLSGRGVAYALPAYKVPETSRTSRGVRFHQLLPDTLSADERIETVLPVNAFSESVYLLLLTRHGWIKKTPLLAFEKITARGLIAVSLAEGDDLVRASLCEATDSVILCSSQGQAVRFDTSEAQLRASGRQSRGVKSMRMSEGDTIVDMFVIPGGSTGDASDGSSSGSHTSGLVAASRAAGDAHEGMTKVGGMAQGQGAQLVAVTRCGFGKRVPLDAFRVQRRGGKGVIAMKFKRCARLASTTFCTLHILHTSHLASTGPRSPPSVCLLAPDAPSPPLCSPRPSCTLHLTSLDFT